MNAAEITLVQNSFSKIVPVAGPAAALFYARLFELDPSLRPLFHGDMTEQGNKLMQVLALAVGSLERLATVLPAVRQLGVKHVAYGVKESHYETVGEALLWTLEKGLGDDFTPAVRAAWAKTYALFADTMKDAARGAQAAAA